MNQSLAGGAPYPPPPAASPAQSAVAGPLVRQHLRVCPPGRFFDLLLIHSVFLLSAGLQSAWARPAGWNTCVTTTKADPTWSNTKPASFPVVFPRAARQSSYYHDHKRFRKGRCHGVPQRYRRLFSAA